MVSELQALAHTDASSHSSPPVTPLHTLHSLHPLSYPLILIKRSISRFSHCTSTPPRANLFPFHATPTPSPSLCSSLLHSQVHSTFQHSTPSLFTYFTLPVHPRPAHHYSMHPPLHRMLAPLCPPSTTLLCSSLPTFWLIAPLPVLVPSHSSFPPPLHLVHSLDSSPRIIPPLLPSILPPNLRLLHPPLLHSLLPPTSLLSSQPPTRSFLHHPTRISPHSRLLPPLPIVALPLHASPALSRPLYAHIPSPSPTTCSLLFTCCTLCYLLKHSRNLPIQT